MITEEIKNSLLPSCEMYIRAKGMENKSFYDYDYAKNYKEVIEIEMQDAECMMKRDLQAILKGFGRDLFTSAVSYCKEYINSPTTKKTRVSIFENAHSVNPVNISLYAFLNSKKHIDKINQIRLSDSKEKKDELKKMLPCATISGTFTKRSIEGIDNYNGLVCIDFDGKDNDKTPEQMKAILKDFEEVLYCGLSVSGKGVYAIIRTDNSEPKLHSKVVIELGDMFEKFGLKYDKSCKDISRLRFVSFDKNGYLNEDAISFQTSHIQLIEQPKQQNYTFGKGKNNTEELVIKYVSAIQSSKLDITDNYEDWVRIGFALASYFGYEGEDYFLTVSQNSPKYNLARCVQKYRNFVKCGRRINIGTFITICKNNNIKI